jgi:hypothetical protein
MKCKNKGKIFCDQELRPTEFITKQEKARYRQIRTTVVEKTIGKWFEAQMLFVPETEQVPLARQVVMGMVVHFLLTGQRLFPAHSVRCADSASTYLLSEYKGHVRISPFDVRGFGVYWSRDQEALPHLGLASALKYLNLVS